MTDTVQWSSIPSLADKISKDDVHQKGKGHFAADYVSWAKTAQLMNEYANGWLFALVKNSQDNWVHAAPDGTGFLVGIFIGPQGEVTPQFPYAITNHKNETIPIEQIGARTFTDSHRRAFCAAAAWQFNLAYQLWAREEIEEPAIAEDSTPRVEIQQEPVNQGKAGKAKEVGQPPAESADPGPIDKALREAIIADLGAAQKLDLDKFSKFVQNFQKEFNIPSGTPIRDHITNEHHAKFCMAWLTIQQGSGNLLSSGVAGGLKEGN